MHARAARRLDPKGLCWETWKAGDARLEPTLTLAEPGHQPYADTNPTLHPLPATRAAAPTVHPDPEPDPTPTPNPTYLKPDPTPIPYP